MKEMVLEIIISICFAFVFYLGLGIYIGLYNIVALAIVYISMCVIIFYITKNIDIFKNSQKEIPTSSCETE